MQDAFGTVVSLRGDSVLVDVDDRVVCRRCESGKGCGAGLLGRKASDRRIEARLGPGDRLQCGDRVSVSLMPKSLLQAAWIVYGVPLFAAVLGAALAWSAGLGDLPAALAALAGLGVGYALARVRLRRTRCLREFMPTVASTGILRR